jgi:hypothetical protein
LQPLTLLQGPDTRCRESGFGQREPIDALEVFDHIRDITDPEHPYTLEQLNVVEEHLVDVDDAAGSVRLVKRLSFKAPFPLYI